METIGKGTVVAGLESLPGIWLYRPRKTTKTVVGVIDVPGNLRQAPSESKLCSLVLRRLVRDSVGDVASRVSVKKELCTSGSPAREKDDKYL